MPTRTQHNERMINGARPACAHAYSFSILRNETHRCRWATRSRSRRFAYWWSWPPTRMLAASSCHLQSPSLCSMQFERVWGLDAHVAHIDAITWDESWQHDVWASVTSSRQAKMAHCVQLMEETECFYFKVINQSIIISLLMLRGNRFLWWQLPFFNCQK